MEILTDLLKIIIPAIIVSATVLLLISKHIKNEELRRDKELSLKNREITLPLRFQSLERLVLLMERISLDNMLLRIASAGLSVEQFKFELMRNVTHEFEHNLSQQLYVSDQTWNKIIEAREFVLSTINANGEGLDPMAPAQHLTDRLIPNITANEITPLKEAIFLLKKESEKLGK